VRYAAFRAPTPPGPRLLIDDNARQPQKLTTSAGRDLQVGAAADQPPRESATRRISTSPAGPCTPDLSGGNCGRAVRGLLTWRRSLDGRTWTLFGNHWPSRSGGQAESAGYRHIAGETLSYFHQRALEVHGPGTPAFVMGDFNDEPFDTSLVLHALSTRQQRKVTSAATQPVLWNLMWPVMGGPAGSFYFDNQPNMLDQFLVNKNMATTNAPITVDPASVHILRFDGMTTGTYHRPRPFGGMGKPVDQDGYSDHFPISIRAKED
jgi:hypothetical protein